MRYTIGFHSLPDRNGLATVVTGGWCNRHPTEAEIKEACKVLSDAGFGVITISPEERELDGAEAERALAAFISRLASPQGEGAKNR